MKKIIIMLLVFILIGMNCMVAFSLDNDFNIEQVSEKAFGELTSFEQQNILELLNDKKDIVLKINRLNYNNPISFENDGKGTYKVKLWREFYDIGSIELTIQHKDGNIIYQDILNSKNEISVNLENTKEYYYDIKVNCNDGTTILYFGEIYNSEDGVITTNILYRDQDNYNAYDILLNNDDSTLQENDYVIESIRPEEFIVPMVVTPDVIYEKSGNNNSTAYAQTINNNNVIGTMYDDRVDYYKIVFNRDGKANFWLGEIPYQKPHYLYVYKTSESSSNLVGSSLLSGSQQLISEKTVSKGTTYYIKVVCPDTVNIPTQGNYKLRAKLVAKITWPGSTSPTIPYNINACYNCPKYKENTGVNHDHYGIDIAGSLGQNIYSILDGKVYNTDNDSESGNFIWIDHIDNPVASSTGTYLRSFYCHMRYESSYSSGNLVWSGTNIGQVGTTPNVSAHLHFGAYYSNNGSTYYRFNPLKLWSDKSFKCGCCGNYASTNSKSNEYASETDEIVTIDENINISQISDFISRKREVGILINETFIDIETLLSMPEIDITRFGLNKLDLEYLSNMIELDKEYNTYINELKSLSLEAIFD